MRSWVVLLFGLLVLALAACHPAPVASTGGAAGTGGSPVPDPVPRTCATACAHYRDVCGGGADFCNKTCPGIAVNDPGYVACLAGATGCMNCDAQARGVQLHR